MTITIIPLAPEACENPNPAVAEHAVCCLIATAGDRCSWLRKKGCTGCSGCGPCVSCDFFQAMCLGMPKLGSTFDGIL